MNRLDPFPVWRDASSRNNLSRPSCADLVTPTAAMISRSVCFLYSQLCAVTGEQSSRTMLFRNARRRVKKETPLKTSCSASQKHRNTRRCERKDQIKSVSVPSAHDVAHARRNSDPIVVDLRKGSRRRKPSYSTKLSIGSGRGAQMAMM